MKLFLVSFLFLCSLNGFSQTNISGIVNSYFSVTGINQPSCDPCDKTCINTITVSNGAGLAAGDKALIIQMKGAVVDNNNTINGGKVTAINNTGNYEFFEIKSIVGNVLTPMYPLIKSYTLTDMVQVVKVPKYTGTVNINNILTAKDWTTTDKTGGVLAIEADRLVFNANINVAGKGYQGIQMTINGPDNNCNFVPNTQYVLSSTATSSFTKGDGIVIDDPAHNRGRAPRANGGGSGIAGDSGGGGGSNYGAGGEGGKRWCNVDGDNAGGLGGVSLSTYFAQDRVFLGGAGGSGYVTTNNPSSAADGGGIVIIFANEIVGNGHSIIADGFSPEAVNPSGDPDGGGGGGAGGTVVLKTPLFTGNLSVSARGGDGQDLNTNTQHGPGGGGGGGALLYSLAALPSNVTLNAGGGIGGEHLNAARNGSQDGSTGGSVSLYIPIENPNYMGIDDNDGLDIQCDLDDDNDGILDTVEIPTGLADPFGYQTGSKKPNFINKNAPGFIDSNQDGIDDRYDNDLDGMINQLDLDSDNDGCPDSIEAYGNTNADPDGNGFYSTGNPPATLANGTVAAASYAAPVNTTGTSKPNYLVSNIVAITTNPANANTNLGGNVTFTTVVSGTHLVYTWKQSTNAGATWTTVTNGGTNPAFSNASTNALTLTNIPRSFNGYLYRLDVTSTSNVCAQPNSNTAALSVANRNPVASNNNYTVKEDETVTLNPLNGDTDADGDTLVIESINGTTLTGLAQSISVTNGTVNISAAGVITFTPSLNFNSVTALSIPYVINDGFGGTATANQLITVTAVNDNPVANNDPYTVAEDNTVTLTPLANDTDVEGDALTITSINGTTLTGGVQTITVPNGTVNISALGVITFTPSANFTSTTPISFPYVISDGHTGTATANIQITVTAVNDAPVANNDPYTVAEDNTVTLTPLANDTDIDGDTLTISSINGTTLTGGVQSITVPNGTVNISALGVITFTPSADFNSTTAISFPYIITDGVLTSTANIEITVTAVNDAPIAIKDDYSVNEGATLTVLTVNGVLSNDTDVEGNSLTAILVTGPAHGTLTLNSDGSFTYTHDGSETIKDSFTYKANDGNLDSNVVTVEITVNPVNDAPVANNDPYTVAEDNSVTLTPLSNDTDVDGDALTISSINGTALTGGVQVITVPNGTVNISALGVITFTPSADFNSTTAISFPYVITDGNLTSTANIQITVTAVNDAPVANNDPYTVAEDNSVTLTPLSNDTDVEGDTLTISSINGTTLTGGVQSITVPNGTVNISALGVITFTPSADFNSTTAISFPYIITDGVLTSTANIEITVTAVNDAPVAIKDDYSVNEGATLTVLTVNGVLSNDTDVEGNSLTAILVTGPAHGTLTLNSDGSFTYTHDGSETIKDSFTYKANDGNLDSNVVTVEITVNPVNDAPVANNDPYTVAEDNSVTLTPLSNDTDVDGDTLAISSINGTTLTGGVQSITVPNGTVNISALGVITFTPSADFNSTTAISFPYVITDGALTSTANIEITVTAVNDAPVANNDPYTVAEDNTVTLTPLSNDTDVEGDTLTISSINGTTLTGGVQSITVPNGTVNISALGVITFTPSADFNSTTAISFPYVITDGNLTATANIEITVTAVNDAPVANNDPYTVAEDNSVTLTPLTNDTDVEGDTLTISSINGTTLTGGVQSITVPNGTVNISALGVITFTPSSDFNSTTAISFPYVITDGNLTSTANIEITVTAVNDAPVANNDPYTVAEDNTVTLTPLSNDTDIEGDTLTISSINGTTLTGGVQVITVPNGTVNISALGVITFTPSTDFNSTTAISFPYVITDGSLTATANIQITVTAVNDAPVANNDPYTVAEDNSVTLTPLTNDTDIDGDTLTISSINGTTLTGGVQSITVPNGTVNISALGVITFTPSTDFNSTTAISFPYVITDGSLTSTANIEITVTAVNDAPVANNDPYTVAEDNSVTLTPLSNDTDVEGDTLTISSINGTTLTGGVQSITVPNGTVNISALGVITFTPSADFNSTTAISFPYVITDGSLTATANIQITVTAVNDAPVANNDPYTVAEDNSVTLTPLSNDTDVDGDTLTISSINGTTLTGGVQSITVPNGTVNISALGVITFTPSTDFNSTTAISFPYVITDGSLTATANIEITVTAVNDAPIAIKDDYTVDEGATLNVPVLTGVLSNDTDVEGDVLTAVLVTGPSHGTLTLNSDGSFTYVHDGSETITDSFTYKANDGNLDSNTITVTLTINPVNDAPIANDDTNNAIASAAGATTINALTAADVDGTIANYTILSLPANGVLNLAGNPIAANQVLTPAEAATITYTPSGAFTGNVTFTFTATDNLGLSAVTPATITIPVGNNAPVAHDDTNSHIPSRAGATAIKALTATDTDGTIVNYIVVTLPSNGVLALSGVPVAANQILTPAEAAMLTYDPSGIFSGNDTFTFTATDNNGVVDATPAVITIPVDKTILVATPDPVGSVVGINEVVKVINVLDNDTLNNDPLLLTDVKLDVLVPDPNNVLTLKPDGTIELIPNAPAGTYTLTYEICELANSSNCTSATVTVTVEAPKMTVTASSYCSDNTPYVQYKVTADNFIPKDLVTINWIDSANNIVATQTNMPLSGNVLWPGTVVDSNNKPIDWPGWVLVNGQWIEGNDGFQLTRPAVTMQFSLNPTESITVNYPAPTSGCNARPHFGIEAENDDDNIIADGLNGSPEVINVLDNDKLNGVPVNPADVILTPRDFPTGITLNSDGTIDVAPGTKGGSHTLTYQICEKANNANCTDATVKIFVEVPSITVVMKVELNDHNKNDNAEAGETLTYTFTITNNGNVPLQNITISDLLPGVIITGGPINLAVGESDSHTFTATYTLTQADINAGTVTNQATVSGTTQSGIKVEDKSDSANENGDAPTAIDVNGCKIKIFNAVSLNGDNMNERFYIRGIECYPDNTVQIFNRWGVLVFERDHYNNNDIVFKGFSEGRTTVKESNGLPEGTYYYIVRYKDNNSSPKQEAGYLYLTK
ncbi:gliding motility-associated-like protein [Flavobacterium sp. HSC-32F16]|uniref:Ig-like domain-containing protein n=1 Tax=Flavobacterium sp. HSC-32F16 TaxID=2910964 RepID=UPI0020A40E7A|nr:Ig-like domain-containing protein [Flavobacterium sp. HSC-32F16]MCP2029676.1 gliding motility-associated-like protein [Flavobacterium sp. HSC-32F16]